MENAKDSSTMIGEEAANRLRIADGLEVKLRKYRKFARIGSCPPDTWNMIATPRLGSALIN